jgi:uncharacterized alpha-E superfamily protein
MGTRFHEANIGSIVDYGLHESIVDFIARNQQVAHAIEQDYRFYS